MNEEELIQHIFELSFAIDNYSAANDYAALRKTHYENVQWLHDNGFQEEYYHFFIKAIKEQRRK